MLENFLGRTARNFLNLMLCGGLLAASGCISTGMIPESVLVGLDRTISFKSLQDQPEKYKGATIPLGGVILEARNFKEGARLEILQLPLDRTDRPTTRWVDSEGRFMVYHSGFLETAVYQRGRYVTVIGEVTGKEIRMIDEVEYIYPSLRAKHIYLWSEGLRYPPSPLFPPYPTIRPYRGGPYLYDPWWPYGYDPWRPYWYYPWSPPMIHPPEKDRPPPKRRFDPGRKSSSPPSKGANRGFK